MGGTLRLGNYECTIKKDTLAYDDYKKLPVSKRKERVEHKYAKMIEKYNIKMNNMKAKIDHYDMRAMEDAKDAIDKAETYATVGEAPKC